MLLFSVLLWCALERLQCKWFAKSYRRAHHEAPRPRKGQRVILAGLLSKLGCHVWTLDQIKRCAPSGELTPYLQPFPKA